MIEIVKRTATQTESPTTRPGSVAALVAHILQVSGLTNEQLARRMNVHPSQLSRWKRQRDPKASVLEALQAELIRVQAESPNPRSDCPKVLDPRPALSREDLRREIDRLLDAASPETMARVADELRLEHLRLYVAQGRADLLHKALDGAPVPVGHAVAGYGAHL